MTTNSPFVTIMAERSGRDEGWTAAFIDGPCKGEKLEASAGEPANHLYFTPDWTRRRGLRRRSMILVGVDEPPSLAWPNQVHYVLTGLERDGARRWKANYVMLERRRG